MRQLFLFISFLIFSFSCLLGHATTVTNGDRSYQEKDFTKALQYYREQVASAPSSSGYYNLGNTYYRLKEYGQSVLAYRRALRLDPGNTDARHNLALVETHLTNPIPKTDNSVWEALLNDWIDIHSLAFWTYCIFIFLLVSFFGLCIWRFSSRIFVQKTGFSLCCIGVLLVFLSVFSAYRAHTLYNDTTTAVVTGTSLQTSTTESGLGKAGPTLYEGTTVHILDHVSKTTYKIQLPNGVSVFCKVNGLTLVAENKL